MKKLVMTGALFICVLLAISLGQEIRPGSHEFVNAMKLGPTAKVTLKIIDSDGGGVPKAKVLANFEWACQEGIEGTADTNGVFSMEDKSRGEMHYGVEKEGYYSTSSSMTFGGQDGVIIKDGKWQPWDPTIKVVLKKIKNPVPMYAIIGEFEIPTKGVPVGLDLEKLDWVAPYGKGVNSDILVSYDEVIKDPWTGKKSLSLTFGTNMCDGVQCAKLDGFSDYHSQYEAPTNGYQKSLKWERERTKEKILTNIEPQADEYFIFRVRTVTDKNGTLIKAYYGKVYGPVEYGMRGGRPILRMICYFNPEVNSRNLEFATKKNLSEQRVHIP